MSRSTPLRGNTLAKTVIILACGLILHCPSVSAQVDDMNSPLGATSPLGIGPGAPVGPAGIPLGATELAVPGVSPPPPGASPFGSAGAGVTNCSGVAGHPGAPMEATAPFDGGGISGTASGTCATGGGGTSASGTPSPSSPVGRSGIPLGATQLSPGGLSPPPLVVRPSPSISPVTPSPMVGSSPSSALPPSGTASPPPADQSSPSGSSSMSPGGAAFGSSRTRGSPAGR